VQAETRRRRSLGAIGRCGSLFSGKVVCDECGGLFGKKVWGSYKSNKTYRREVYQCNEKYKRRGSCQVSAEKRPRPLTTIHTGKKGRNPKAACFKHFQAMCEPPADKIPFINRW
jgi:hypothetical protein